MGSRAAALGLAVTTVTTGVVLLTPLVAGADASSPTSATGTAVVNADGTITVTVEGRWAWPTHNSDCNDDRYGNGWAIDWGDPSQPGNVLGTLNGVTIDVGVAVGNARNPADNKVHYITNPRCGVYDPAVGYNSGYWGAYDDGTGVTTPLRHTYPAGTTNIMPCAVTYDIHGSARNGPDAKDLVASDAKDNSVEKNGATPSGNTCTPIVIPPPPTTTPPTAPPTTPPPGSPPTTQPPGAPPTTPAPPLNGPAIRIVKRVNTFDSNAPPGLVVAPGSTLVFTYDVTNTGNVPLTAVRVTDDKGLAVTCPGTTLAVGATMVCTAIGVAPAAGQYTNVGTATGTPPTGPPVSSNDPANALVPAPSLHIIKAINGADANTPPGLPVVAGSLVTWTYRVENTGNVDVVNISVTDDKGAQVDCGGGSNVIAVLKPAEVKTCTATGTAILGVYTNVGAAVGTPNPPLLPGQPPVPTPQISSTDPATYTGSPSVAVEPPAVQLPEGELPATGSGNGWIAALAAALVGCGALLVALTTARRRRRTLG